MGNQLWKRLIFILFILYSCLCMFTFALVIIIFGITIFSIAAISMIIIINIFFCDVPFSCGFRFLVIFVLHWFLLPDQQVEQCTNSSLWCQQHASCHCLQLLCHLSLGESWKWEKERENMKASGSLKFWEIDIFVTIFLKYRSFAL